MDISGFTSLLDWLWAVFILPIEWLRGRIVKQEEELDTLRKDLSDNQVDNAKQYVTKEDLVVYLVPLNNKIDSMNDDVKEIKRYLLDSASK